MGRPVRLTPITLREANVFVDRHHRHHRSVAGCLFCVAVADDTTVHGVAIVGRPVARGLQDGYTAEVLRCCTDSTPNVASKLYAACWRACRAIGYTRLVTYTLATETGASVKAAGWRTVGETRGRSWDTPGAGRPRVDWHPTLTTGVDRVRWEAV